ncbi:MAG: DEAD/DEAH box helicase [Verrucomicrobiota bacterium]|nr:DEAD/DEAH box helicase [Verrucomicrobiota bacterium]
MPFSFLNSVPEVLKSVVESGYVTPTPIQEAAIPKILEGQDILASAQTGSGKTAAFLLPALHKIKVTAKSGFGPKVLILVPTRELAMQVASQAVKYSKYMDRVTTVCLYGGAPYPTQNRQLSRPYEILVATPGRLIDHMERGRIDFSQVKTLVLDEADRMLDMGFVKPVEQIAAKLPEGVQTVMFSATFEPAILKLAKTLMKDPCHINLAGTTKKHENIEQALYYADNLPHKLKLINHLLPTIQSQQTIVFVATKFFAEELGEKLREDGFSVGVLHGDLHQRQRTRTIQQMREGKIAILVATDVAARGIDISTIGYVINFDLPANIEDYIHRIGRTGRAEAKGTALSFVLPKDSHLVDKIGALTNKEAVILTIPGLEPAVKERTLKPKGKSSFGKRRPPFKAGPFFKKERKQFGEGRRFGRG